MSSCGRFRTAFVAAAATCATCATAGAAPSPTVVDACIATAAQALRFNGVVHARIDGVTVERSFGTADAAGRVAIVPDTRFDLASASKMITAVAVGLLVDRGAVRFDAPIGDYLPELDAAFRAITIAQLLEHTSGLGNYLVPANLPAIEAASGVGGLLPLALSTPPAFPPGSKRAYSNSGFVVVGAVIERVSGRSYDAFVADEILRPLGMSRTGFEKTDSAVPMTSMSPDGRPMSPAPSPLATLRASPAGGMSSTAADVARLLSAMASGRLLKPETWSTLTQPRPDPGGGPGLSGYGFNVATRPRLRLGHGGGAPGINAEVAFYPASRIELIALSNRDPPTATRMVAVLEHAVFDDAPCAPATDSPVAEGPAPPASNAGNVGDRR